MPETLVFTLVLKSLWFTADEVKLIQACFLAIRQAHAVTPTQANAMSDKLSRMLGAMESDDGNEANRLWSELQPDVQR